MARIARVVIPNVPHHVTQRGNRRQKVFFQESDYQEYVALMSEWCGRFQIEVWAYCLMPNHVHLIVVPKSEKDFQMAIGEAHRRYSRMINFREGWRGHLWQGRFASYPMDDRYLLKAARYIELNPVRAKIIKKPENYPWSSALAHLSGTNDLLVTVKPLLLRTESWETFLGENMDEETISFLQKHERTGKPLGEKSFVRNLEKETGRRFLPKKPGPKRKMQALKGVPRNVFKKVTSR